MYGVSLRLPIRVRFISGALAAAAVIGLSFLAATERASAAVNDVVINEYNAVSGANYLGGVNESKVDTVFGRLQGNGQNWMELLVVQDNMDLRGQKIEWSYNQDFLGEKIGSGSLTFTNDPLWSNVRQGTIITLTEWQEAWYFDEGPNTTGLHNFSRQGGVNGIGNLRNNAFDSGTHQFVDLSTDLRWNPELGDWHINVFAGERELATGNYKYFTFAGSVTEDGNTHTIGIDNDAGVFAVNNDNWEATIRNASNVVQFGPVGEAVEVPDWAGGGINSGEVGKIEHDDVDQLGPPPTEANYRAVSNASFRDGSSSTFGTSNVATGYVQNVDALRTAAFSAADVVQRNSTADSLFSDGTRWAGGTAPGAGQQATFNQGSAAPYTVSFDASTQSDTLVVRNDKVNFDLNGNTYTAASADDYKPSIVIGQSSGQTAVVSVADGTLAGTVANVGQQTGSSGSLAIEPNAVVSLSRSLFIGGADDRRGGSGSVSVEGSLIVGKTAKVLSSGSLTLDGGTATIGSGAAETVADTLRIWGGGTLDLRGGSVTAANVALSSGTIGGYGSLASNIATSGGTINALSYDDGLAGQLTLSGGLTSSAGSTLTKLGGGSLTISGAQSHGAGSALVATAGTTNLNSDAGGNLAINAQSTVNFGASQHLSSLTVAADVDVTSLAGGDNVTVAADLSIAGSTNAWTGRLDVNDNGLILQSNPVDRAGDLATLTNQIKSGYNGGAWDGTGVTSTEAALDGMGLAALGVILNDNGLGGAIHTTFLGETVGSNSILVALTSYGDADLDGAIGSIDYALIDNGFNFALTGWLNGDFNYDGLVDHDDYALIDNSFSLLGGSAAAAMIALHSETFGAPYVQSLASLQAVPEPSALALLAIGAITLALRRRTLRRLFSVAAIGAATAVVCTPASAALVVNLRLADGSTSRTLAAGDAGTDIPIQVWATVTNAGGINGAGIHEGLQYLNYSLTSQRSLIGPTGSINGDLHTPSLVTPFDANGASAGDVLDLNGDNINDLGSLSASADGAFAKPRAETAIFDTTAGVIGQPIAGGFEFLVETIQFHVDSLPPGGLSGVPAGPAGNGTQINAAIPSWIAGFVKGANWFQDSNETPTNGANNGAYTAGTGVTLKLPTWVLGDMNGDGVRNNFDIQPLEIALTNVALYNTNWGLADYQLRGDINHDGTFDNFDIQPLERLLAPQPMVIAFATVPEPGSLTLLGLGLLGLILIGRRQRRA